MRLHRLHQRGEEVLAVTGFRTSRRSFHPTAPTEKPRERGFSGGAWEESGSRRGFGPARAREAGGRRFAHAFQALVAARQLEQAVAWIVNPQSRAWRCRAAAAAAACNTLA